MQNCFVKLWTSYIFVRNKIKNNKTTGKRRERCGERVKRVEIPFKFSNSKLLPQCLDKNSNEVLNIYLHLTILNCRRCAPVHPTVVPAQEMWGKRGRIEGRRGGERDLRTISSSCGWSVTSREARRVHLRRIREREAVLISWSGTTRRWVKFGHESSW